MNSLTLPRLGWARALSLSLLFAGCSDDGDDGTKKTSESPSPTSTSAAVEDEPEGEPEGTSPSGAAQANDSEPEPAAANPGGTVEPAPARPVPGVTPAQAGPIDDELIEDVCVKAAECTGDSVDACLDELPEAVSELLAICPQLAAPYLECLATVESCVPEMECGEEITALATCGVGGTVDVAPETVSMACATWAECDGSDAAQCEVVFEATQGVFEGLCPGAFGPYLECLAQVTGCDVRGQCAEEVAVLEACGLELDP